jgi:diguanylate cyclase (GGDEF)-like protein
LLLVRQLTVQGPGQAEGLARLLPAVGLLFAAVFGFVYQWMHWVRPMRRAIRLLPEVRKGEATIAELDVIRGGIKPLIGEVQETLKELRRQKAELARFEMEMRQRVANRTDALERNLAALKHTATKDGLTGLNNRRMFDLELPLMVARCRESGVPLSLLMIDVDDFKLLNDTLGHAAGDEFLRSLGQMVRSTLRTSDMAYRYGGDEFVIVIPGGGREQADPLSGRLISLVDGFSKTLHVSRPPRLSIGVFSATDLRADSTPEMLLMEADRLLYETKLARKRARAA